MTMTLADEIRAQGPCAFCGHPYAFHRTADTQKARVVAGDHYEDVADDYGTTVRRMRLKWAALDTLTAEAGLVDP